jgi:hypothetical protein
LQRTTLSCFEAEFLELGAESLGVKIQKSAQLGLRKPSAFEKFLQDRPFDFLAVTGDKCFEVQCPACEPLLDLPADSFF